MKLLLLLLFTLFVSTSFSQIHDLEIGNQAPEIKLANPEGDTISLSSFKGKVVLIDFWATWCAPCIAEQSELVTLYKKYKHLSFTSGMGFEIFGVSLDNKKDSWLSQIKKKKITWTQVSDLKYWNSPIAKTYNIQALPFNLLIDKNGVIIAKNLHGVELEEKLAEIKID